MSTNKSKRVQIINLQPQRPPAPLAPVPLSQSARLPPFPMLERVLPSWSSEYLRASSDSAQVPLDTMGGLGVAMLSAAVAGKFEACGWGDWREPLNIYMAVAAEPGERKTAAFSAVTEVFQEYERRLRREVMPAREAALERQQARAERRAALRKRYGRATDKAERDQLLAELDLVAQEDRDDAPPPVPQLWTSNATPEALTSSLAEHGRMAVVTDEGSSVFDNLSRYSANGTPNLSPWLEGIDGSPIRVQRKKATTEDARGLLTAALALQPEALRSLASSSRLAGLGFVQRWLFVLPTSRRGFRQMRTQAVPDLVVERYREGVRALLELPLEEKPRRLFLSADAEALLEGYANELETAQRPGGIYQHGVLAGWASKHHGRCLRLAGVLHLARYAFDLVGQAEPIEGDTMAGAVELCRYFEAHARAAFDAMVETQAERDAHDLAAYVDGKGLERFTARDLLNVNRWRESGRRSAALALLVDLGQVVKEPNKVGTGEAYRRVHPSVQGPVQALGVAGAGGVAGGVAGTHRQQLNGLQTTHSDSNSPESSRLLAAGAESGGTAEEARAGGAP